MRRRVRLLLNYLLLQQLQREKNAMKLINRAFVNHAHQRSASFEHMKIWLGYYIKNWSSYYILNCIAIKIFIALKSDNLICIIVILM